MKLDSYPSDANSAAISSGVNCLFGSSDTGVTVGAAVVCAASASSIFCSSNRASSSLFGVGSEAANRAAISSGDN